MSRVRVFVSAAPAPKGQQSKIKATRMLFGRRGRLGSIMVPPNASNISSGRPEVKHGRAIVNIDRSSPWRSIRHLQGRQYGVRAELRLWTIDAIRLRDLGDARS